MTEPLIEARGIRRVYPGRHGLFRPAQPRVAVDGVDLTVAPGEIVGIVGESGCGKSTLGRILCGLDRPTEGSVRLAGRDLRSLDRLDRARLIQPVFQDPYSSLNPRRRIGDIVRAPLDIHHLGSTEERHQRTLRALDHVGLEPRHAGIYPSQLSGGQRQRVAIARALILEPSLIVCDEPTSALDVSMQSQILNLLLDIRRRMGLGCVFISHNLAVVQHIADRVLVMYLGRVVEEMATARLLRSPRHPYTQVLCRSVLTPEPRLGIPDAGPTTESSTTLTSLLGCRFHPRCPEVLSHCATVSPPPVTPTRAACHRESEPLHVA